MQHVTHVRIGHLSTELHGRRVRVATDRDLLNAVALELSKILRDPRVMPDLHDEVRVTAPRKRIPTCSHAAEVSALIYGADLPMVRYGVDKPGQNHGSDLPVLRVRAGGHDHALEQRPN